MAAGHVAAAVRAGKRQINDPANGSGVYVDAPQKQDPAKQTSSLESNSQRRGVAQPGSAPALGAGGRVFESRRPDQPSLLVHAPNVATDRWAAVRTDSSAAADHCVR